MCVCVCARARVGFVSMSVVHACGYLSVSLRACVRAFLCPGVRVKVFFFVIAPFSVIALCSIIALFSFIALYRCLRRFPQLRRFLLLRRFGSYCAILGSLRRYDLLQPEPSGGQRVSGAARRARRRCH